MKRRYLSGRKAARKFNRSSARTKRINVAPPPSRGGYRL